MCWMFLDRLKSKWLWVGGGLLLALLALVAVLQYRWINQLSEADRRQREDVLAMAVRNFRRDFTESLHSPIQVFRPSSGVAAGTDLGAHLAERLARWQRNPERSALLNSVALGVETADGEFIFKQRDVDDEAFVPKPWPDELAQYREILEKRLRRPDGGLPLYPRGFASELVNDHPMLVFPLVEEADTLESEDELRGRELSAPAADSRALLRTLQPVSKDLQVQAPELKGWVFLETDTEFLQSDLIPDLIERHFGQRGLNEYIFFIRTGQRVLFQFVQPPALMLSDKPWVTDARATIFSRQILAPFPGPSLTERRGRGRRGSGRPFGRRNVPYLERSSPPAQLVEEIDPNAWQLEVAYKFGSLGEEVNRTRRRNLAFSFGSLLILGGSIALLGLAAQRSRRLARQQMEFVAGVSHELRTPLAVIQSTSFNLARGTVVDPNRVRQYGAAIQTEVRRLSNQVEQMLSFAGILSGRKLYDLRPVNAAEVVERSLAEFAPALEEGGWQVERRIADDLPNAIADEQALESAVKNLIQNAMKYAAEGKWLGTTVEADGTDKIKITIADRGAGIDPADLPHVFEPFYRGKKVLASPVSGAGLGLSLVERHIRAMGGNVTVNSSPQTGTEFTLHLQTANK